VIEDLRAIQDRINQHLLQRAAMEAGFMYVNPDTAQDIKELLDEHGHPYDADLLDLINAHHNK
jgi:hypothetical protein